MKTVLLHICKVLLPVCLIFGGFSCDYLDIVPDEKATEKDAFEDISKARNFLYSCYSYLPKPRNETQSIDLMTADEVVTAFEHETFAAFPKGNYSSSNTVISYWNTLFQGLKQCYILINNIDKVPNMTDDVKADYVGQARFLIAYYHYLLIVNYGPVILIKEEPDLNTPANEFDARTPYDECVQWTCEQFDLAAADLPPTRTGFDYGLATSVVAKGFKAKLLMYAASPLFNGNTEYYADFTNKDGIPLMSQSYDAGKWSKAKTAFEEAIAVAKAAGHDLYTTTDYTGEGSYKNDYPNDPLQRTLRYNIIAPANPDILWADCRDEGAYGIQNKSTPWSTSSAYNGVAPTLTMLKRFNTKNGLPIDKDPDYNYAGIFDVVTVDAEHADVAEQGLNTLYFNLHREPRYYAWVAFQSGFYEIMNATTSGAYTDDISHTKYRTATAGRLVCDFVGNGNTARKGRTSNYSPTGFLNKKGVMPGFPVSTGLVYPPFYPWPVLRLTDLYLGMAEVSAEVDDLTTAKTYLDYVRQHAGIPKVDDSWTRIGVTLTKQQLIDVIRNERMVEMYLENQTFWDIRRWKLADKYFNIQARGMNIDATTIENYAQEAVVIYERKFQTPMNYLMPIPIDDVNKNMNLVQNPGY